MKKSFFAFLVLLLFGEVLIAQQNDPTRFSYFRGKRNAQGVTSIFEFWDSTTNKVVKTIKLYEESPFAQLNATQVATVEDDGTPIYKMGVETLLKDSLFYQQERPQTIPKGTTEIGLVSSYNRSVNSREYLAIVFSAHYQPYYEGHHYPSRIYLNVCAVHVYNQKGDLVHKTPILPYDGHLIEVTDDGRFVVFNTGNDHGEGRTPDVPPGFVIYDAQEQKVILRDTSEFTALSVAAGRYVLISKRANIDDENFKNITARLSFVDPLEKLIYYIEVDESKQGWYKSKYTTKEKVVFYHPDKKVTTEFYFSTDFKKQKME